MKINKSLIKTLNKSGPNIEPWSTALVNAAQWLWASPSLPDRLRFVK